MKGRTLYRQNHFEPEGVAGCWPFFDGSPASVALAPRPERVVAPIARAPAPPAGLDKPPPVARRLRAPRHPSLFLVGAGMAVMLFAATVAVSAVGMIGLGLSLAWMAAVAHFG